MRKTRASMGAAPCLASTVVTSLILSKHDGVRRQLVAYLGRSPRLQVSGDLFSPEAILQTHPDALVFDLSQLGSGHRRQAIVAARQVGARLITLASPAAMTTLT